MRGAIRVLIAEDLGADHQVDVHGTHMLKLNLGLLVMLEHRVGHLAADEHQSFSVALEHSQ